MFLLVLAHPGYPGQNPESRIMIVCVEALILIKVCHPLPAAGHHPLSITQPIPAGRDFCNIYAGYLMPVGLAKISMHKPCKFFLNFIALCTLVFFYVQFNK